ncbi:MAG TPA: thiamine phosphate synthase [Desulfurivibrionaceae bacterium]|nr:thiamine phosphate synthase [Desulfurivibrionaceae bacterium]
MSKPRTLNGVYAITDPIAGQGEQLLRHVRLALEGGVGILQYRDKGTDHPRRLAEARALRQLCETFQATFLINDDVALAAESGAHGVHLGKDDLSLSQARARLGEQAIIGVSCYNRLELARAAAIGGADYVAFGRFFPSRTKPGAIQADIALLAQAKAEFSLPVVAIGGITPENGAQLIEQGADALAIIQGIFGQTDIKAAALRHAALFH